MKTERDKRIEQLMKYSKLDLAILLATTEFACEVLSQPSRRAAKRIWNKYMKENIKS